MPRNLKVKIGDTWYEVQIQDLGTNPLEVLVDGEPVTVELEEVSPRSLSEPQQDQNNADAPVERKSALPESTATARVFRTPMPGVILSVLVTEGDQVVTGDEICVLEAMKMHQTLKADWSGIIKTVHVQEGQQILDGDIIVELE